MIADLPVRTHAHQDFKWSCLATTSKRWTPCTRDTSLESKRRGSGVAVLFRCRSELGHSQMQRMLDASKLCIALRIVTHEQRIFVGEEDAEDSAALANSLLDVQAVLLPYETICSRQEMP